MISSSDIGKVKFIDSIWGVKFVGKFPVGMGNLSSDSGGTIIQRKEITVAGNRAIVYRS
jgi:hypothetical protein